MESHAKRKGWWSRPAKVLLSLTLVASGFSSAVVTSKVHAASGTPGGSLQAPVLWLKADDGAAAANGGLTGWQDRSPNPVAFTLDLPNGAKVPQYNESGVNFNPSVKFANPLGAYHYSSSAKLLGDKAITFRSGYTVYKWPEDGSAGALVGSSDQKSSNGVIVMGGYGNSVSTGPGETNVYTYVASTIRDRHQLVNYQIGAPGHTASIDGKNTTVTRSVFPAFSFTPSIGATNAPAQYNWSGLNAEVAEIILYDTITSADAAKIETYLAVKYGITLDHDYIGTDGTLLWSKTANAAYHHNVAGLGKDILEELDQKQSRSINKDTQVAIGLGGLAEANSGNTAALADKQYLIWGDNGKPVKFTEQLGSTDWYLAQRIWKVQNNGTVGEVEIAIPASAAPGAVKLLVSDTDTDFAQATEYELSSITLANKAHYAAKVTLKDGQYFTFAAEAPELQNSLLEQIAQDGHEIVLAFDQEMTTDNLAGFIVEVGGTAVPISSLTYRVDSADSKKLILTLPEGTDVKGKTVNVSYDGTGSLKSTYGAPAKPFAVSPRDQFIDSLKITQPAGSPVNVPKPEITGEAEEGSAVAIVIRDKDGQIVTGAGGNAVVEADGTWSFTPGSDLHDGKYTVEATATKGVKSAVATKGITVNLPVPAIEITAPGGETVTDPKPEFQGTTDPGATVTAVIKDEDDKTIGTPTVTVNADGTWSFKPEAALPYGKYTVEVTSAKNGKTNMASKTITVVDKSKLQAEVDLSSTLDEEDYTPGSWTSYESKLTTAQAVLTSSTATQAEVDTALAELTAAREALVLKPVVDKSKLQAEVDVSSTLDEEDYTPGSWTNYESKLTTAQAVLTSSTATQAEVDTALAELTAAREALVLKPDKSKLQTEVDLSSTLIDEDYTPGSWTNYESKLTTAQAVLTSSTATQAEVDTAQAELTAAREALVLKPVVDKSKLQAEVDVSSTLDEEDYTPGSWTSYESKLTTAQAVLTSSTATQAEVDTALAELTAAREALVLKPDKSKLQAEVDLSSTLAEEDYTPGSWTEYESKLTTAQAVLTSSTATQAEVDTALAELTAAREALVLKPVVDKSKLQAEVDVSSTLDEEDYTPGSWTNYESKLTTAQAVLTSSTATQAEVDTALAELTAAREALVLKPDKSKLQAEVDLSSTLDEEDYTPGSWTEYESKLTTAQAVLTSSTATQAEVDTALAELTAAREALVEVPVVPVVDKSKLQAEVDLSAILDKETYTPASWTSYESMLTDAQAVLASATATQAEVDAALEALQAAYRALVPKSGLASITPSAGAIQPNVTASVYEYSLNVEYKVSELQLTLAAAHPDAAITVNGQAAGTGQASAAVTLNVGDNTVTIVVRETDGSEKTYTVTVRRQSAPNEPSQTPYVPSNTPTPALPVIERITVDVEAIGYGIVAKTEIERTTNNDGSKSDKVTFTTAKALEAVEKTLAAQSPSVRILIPDKQDIVKDVRVELPDAAVKAVQDAGLNLEIYTDNGMITIPNASLSGLNPNLYFHLIPVKQESERKQVEERARTEQIVRKALNNGNVYVVDRPITIETNMTSRPVTITLPLDSSHVPAEARARDAYLSKLAVFIEHSDGERELVKPAVVAYGDNKLGLTFPIGKFSTFTILNLDNGADGSHRAYMVGMPDGTFKPENALTRAQVAMILYRVLALQGADAAPYSDVSGSHWAAEAIRQVTGAGLMKGMTDGSFRPEQSITRAEMAVIIARWKALSGTGEHSYNDALGHWAEKAIGQTKEAGYMEGMLNGSFQPDKALTRAEGVTVFNRILERGPLYGETVPVWSDVPMIHWAFHQIEEASRDHNYTSRPEGGEMMIKP
ncbi:S-layer homology domain-containing protein [Paenibacillus sp. FSL R7-0302]|uniref:S-layer homology domain-containing protein n=1 Tax=Paenibacillus sp. FSL R7-0302 TaxID=2921681 RepID=UPI0030F4C881